MSGLLPLHTPNAALLLASFLVLSACSPVQTPAASANGEIDLTKQQGTSEDELPRAPAAPEPTLKPCKIGAEQECGVAIAAPAETAQPEKTLDPEQRYQVNVLSTDPIRGPKDAVVTLVVFSDFQCPFCGRVEPVFQELMQRYPKQLRVVWKDHPLSMHPWARPAAQLARAAYRQGGEALFWPVHDEIFSHQSLLSDEWLTELAQRHGLSYPPPADPMIDTSLAQAASLGVRSTPTSFINGRPLTGARPLWMYIELIEQELAAHQQKSASAQ